MHRRGEGGDVMSIMAAIAAKNAPLPQGTVTVTTTIVGRPPELGDLKNIMKAIQVIGKQNNGGDGKTKTVTVTKTLSFDPANPGALSSIIASIRGNSDQLMIRSSSTPKPTADAPTPTASDADAGGNRSCGSSRMTFGSLVIDISDPGACGQAQQTGDTIIMTGDIVGTAGSPNPTPTQDGSRPDPAPTPIHARPIMGEMGYGALAKPTGNPLVCSKKSL
ncbi:hypothetical protein H4R21_001783 [Coemansia helicoidea]|uniref:Uncharacterized protein n=1 Tax=Coemansia helicoidea TaxID=1286919 RepID=A0ACC1LAN3_9FUNG|nr:hypothetical protein H4R21_001783 [Coemansia helicoidea]